MVAHRAFLACVVLVATDAFVLVPSTPRAAAIVAAGLVPNGERFLLPLHQPQSDEVAGMSVGLSGPQWWI